MSGKTAGLVFLGVCIALAAVVLLGALEPLVSGAVFAVALVALGGVSKGFTRPPKGRGTRG